MWNKRKVFNHLIFYLYTPKHKNYSASILATVNMSNLCNLQKLHPQAQSDDYEQE